jgi:hypothetical protein
MKELIAKIINFFRYDFFPNLAYYLLQIFLVVVLVLIFAGINIGVRMVTDPICIKVLRMKENKRGPGLVGLGISVIITALLLAWSYAAFPQLRPTVIGWTGHQVQKLFHKTEQLPDLAPAAVEHGAPPERVPGENAPSPSPAPEAGPPPPAHHHSPPG